MFLFVSIFDTAGVQLMAAGQADLLDDNEHLPHKESMAAFSAAALATILGSVMGSSPIIIHTGPFQVQYTIACPRDFSQRLIFSNPCVSSLFLECCAGIADGARTGLHSVVVAVLFIIFLPFVPVLHAVPALVTAPCLIIVGMYMVST